MTRRGRHRYPLMHVHMRRRQRRHASEIHRRSNKNNNNNNKLTRSVTVSLGGRLGRKVSEARGEGLDERGLTRRRRAAHSADADDAEEEASSSKKEESRSGGSKEKSSSSSVSFACKKASASPAPASESWRPSAAPPAASYVTSYHSLTTYATTPPNPEAVARVAKLQSAEGSFALASVEAIVDVVNVRDKCPVNASMYPMAELMWATALAIAYLENRLPADEQTWRLLVKKSRAWLRKAQTDAGLLNVDFIACAGRHVHA